jgi:hypothetical protein
MQISLSTRQTTLYTVEGTMTGSNYETFEYDKAQRFVFLETEGLPAAECVDCKAVIPVELVDTHTMDVAGKPVRNACPSNTSQSMQGHRVLTEEYRAAMTSIKASS